MRKKLLITILAGVFLTAAVATGCGSSATDPSTGSSAESSTKVEESDGVVKPLYSLESAQDAMADGGYSVSFTADDLVKTDDGYELTVEVYDYDRYEKEDIADLKSGDKIQFCNKEIAVDEIEKDSDTGYVQINGGVENDGIELTEEDGLYRTITFDDHPVYYSVGKVTIPLADDVTFEDQANSEQESDLPVVELNDLPDALANSDISFNCNNTVITVRQEKIEQIIRYWIP